MSASERESAPYDNVYLERIALRVVVARKGHFDTLFGPGGIILPRLFATITMATSAPQAFEFTKRKRWADILHSELSVDVLIFILSPACKVLYASPALKNLLGWKETEVVDRDFCTALVHRMFSDFSEIECNLKTVQ